MPRLTWKGPGQGAVVHAVIGGRQSAENSNCPRGEPFTLVDTGNLAGGKADGEGRRGRE